MGRERKSNPRKMRPQFLVLCEGETEEAYINFLKQTCQRSLCKTIMLNCRLGTV